jgi:OOP family OmpA-OmpF porin
MKTLINTVLIGGCIAILANCTGYNEHSEVDALNEVQAVGSPFTQHLTDEYKAFTNREMNKMLDYPDALHFARKGLAAAAGEVVMPEPITDWNLLPKHIEELGTARGRLIVAFDLGAREVAPKQAAIAQARFDCWIEQQEENWQKDDILSCKTEYMNAMDALEGLIQPTTPPALEMPPIAEVAPMDVPEAAEPMKPEDAMYLVFFDFDSFSIGSGGNNVLDAVAEEAKNQGVSLINIAGHTDSSGPKAYNNRLAMKRANAVRDALISRGLDASVIKVEGFGEEKLLVETLDNVREPANRRAQITFE